MAKRRALGDSFLFPKLSPPNVGPVMMIHRKHLAMARQMAKDADLVCGLVEANRGAAQRLKSLCETMQRERLRGPNQTQYEMLELVRGR